MAQQYKLVCNTRIYLDCRKLLNSLLDIIPSLPRDFKYTVGAEMQQIGISLIREVAAAYINRQPGVTLQHLVEFQSQFETLKVLVRIAGERRWVQGRGRFAALIELMDGIGKQSTAWKNAVLQRMA